MNYLQDEVETCFWRNQFFYRLFSIAVSQDIIWNIVTVAAMIEQRQYSAYINKVTKLIATWYTQYKHTTSFPLFVRLIRNGIRVTMHITALSLYHVLRCIGNYLRLCWVEISVFVLTPNTCISCLLLFKVYKLLIRVRHTNLSQKKQEAITNRVCNLISIICDNFDKNFERFQELSFNPLRR